MSEQVEEKTGIPALVVQVVDDFRVAINAGSKNGVKVGQRYLVFGLSGSELLDPITRESLGFLEIVRGRGVVTHVQEKLATVECTEKDHGRRRTIHRSSPIFGGVLGGEREIINEGNEALPFLDVQEGDYARPI